MLNNQPSLRSVNMITKMIPNNGPDHQHHQHTKLVLPNLSTDVYRIMQIIRGGKVSQLHDLLVIRGKTFAIV